MYAQKYAEFRKARSSKASSSTAAEAFPDILDFVTQLSPTYQRPVHLEPVAEVLRSINRGESRHVVIHTPPRHGKTELLLHAIPWLLAQHPRWTMGYASYSEQLALTKSAVAMELAEASGAELRSKSKSEWRNFTRGGALARGIGGGLTGMGLNVGIIDDPVKDRLQAESPVYRERTWSWFADVFNTRIEPGGSVICNMARWHPDDLAGKLVRELGWEYICLPAIDENGKALWPERWPVAELKKKRLNEYTWESLFQGRPRPRGNAVFGVPWGYTALDNTKPRRYAIGIDLSYSGKTSSDWSVIVVMAESEGYFYVVHVERWQVRAPIFRQHLDRIREKYGFPPVRWYASGTEQGTADFINTFGTEGAPIQALHPKGDKFIRALGYSAAWNKERVLLQERPEHIPREDYWLDNFIAEHAIFTGVADGVDDQIDAAVAAYDELVGVAAYGEDDDDDDTRSHRRA